MSVCRSTRTVIDISNHGDISVTGFAPVAHHEKTPLSNSVHMDDEAIPLSLTSAGGQDEKKSLPHKKYATSSLTFSATFARINLTNKL